MFGETNSPEVTLFKMMKSSWEELNLQDIVVPDIPTNYMSDKEDLLSFINNMLKLKRQHRGDYKEFLELAKANLRECGEKEWMRVLDSETRSRPLCQLDGKVNLYNEDDPPTSSDTSSFAEKEKGAADAPFCRLCIPES